MCGRYRRTTSEEELARLYHIPIPEPGRFADQLQHRAESEGPGNSLQPEKSAAFARRRAVGINSILGQRPEGRLPDRRRPS